MDVVYPLIKTIDDNIELRFSLRTLPKHKKLWIIGYKPKWLLNAQIIPFKDEKTKGSNTAEKLWIACNDERISENFIWMNDDIFFLNGWLDSYKLGKLKDVLENMTIKGNHYYSIKAVYDLFPNWDCFDTHTPIIFNKTKLRELFKKYPLWTRWSKRSLYCLENWIKGKWLNVPDYKIKENPKIKDCKCYYIDKFKILDWQEYISTSDWMIKYREMRDLFRSLPPSKYENLDYNYIGMWKTEVLFKANLFPYSKGQIGQIPTYIAERLANQGKVEILREKQNKSMADRVEVVVKDYELLTKKQIMAELDEKGITYWQKDNKQTLIAKLK